MNVWKEIIEFLLILRRFFIIIILKKLKDKNLSKYDTCEL